MTQPRVRPFTGTWKRLITCWIRRGCREPAFGESGCFRNELEHGFRRTLRRPTPTRYRGGVQWLTILVRLIRERRARGLSYLTGAAASFPLRRKNTSRFSRIPDGLSTIRKKSGNAPAK